MDIVRGYTVLQILVLLAGWHELSFAHTALAIAVSILPDWDFALYFLLSKKIPNLYSHRQISHYPLAYFFLLGFGQLFLSGRIVAILGAELFFHFLADTIESVDDTGKEGWGIAWFYPLISMRLRTTTRRDRKLEWVPLNEVPLWWQHVKHQESNSNIGEAIMNRVLKKLFKLNPRQKKFTERVLVAGVLAWLTHVAIQR